MSKERDAKILSLKTFCSGRGGFDDDRGPPRRGGGFDRQDEKGVPTEASGEPCVTLYKLEDIGGRQIQDDKGSSPVPDTPT